MTNPRFFTVADDGLAKDWRGDLVFMNPPYGAVIGRWLQKAFESAQASAVVVFRPAGFGLKGFTAEAPRRGEESRRLQVNDARNGNECARLNSNGGDDGQAKADVTPLVSRIFHPGFQTVAPATSTFIRFRDLSNV